MTDSERVLEIIRVKHLNNVQFCNITGVSSATLSHITSGRSNPTLTILRNIINGFPDLNPMWVYSGEGEMFKEFVDDTTLFQEEGQLTADLAGGKAASSTRMESSKADEAVMATGLRGSRSGNPFLTPDSSSGLDAMMPLARSASEQAASTASLSEVVRETIAQMQPQQRHIRRITEIRIFFDDGTYESFGGPRS